MLVPLGGQCTYEQSRQLGELLARVVAARLPEIATIARLPGDARRPRLHRLPAERPRQAARGALQRAPAARRAGLGAAPLERGRRHASTSANFTIKTLPARMAVFDHDPLAPVLSETPDLVTALERLAARL